MENIHQVIYIMIVTKDLDRKIYDYIYLWGENIASVAWAKIEYYNHNLGFTPVHAVFGIYMLFNFTSTVNWRVLTDSNQR